MIDGLHLQSWGAVEHMGLCLSYKPPRVELAAIFLVIVQATQGPAAAVQVLFTTASLLRCYCFTTALLPLTTVLLLVSVVEASALRGVFVSDMLRDLGRAADELVCCR